MATTTPNFGWPVPTSTDLVSQGAVAIEGLGDAVDAGVWNLSNNNVTVNSAVKTSGRSSSVVENVEGVFLNGSYLSANRSAAVPFYINRSNGTTTAQVVQFYRSGTDAGGINASTTAAPTFVSPSDYRLKENVKPLTDASKRIKSANVYTYNFIADEDQELRYGFIAHEIAGLMNDLVIGEKDGVDEDGKPIYQQVQETRLIPILVAALKDALLRIDVLEAANAPAPTAKK
jgi:hypothetical protein